jgi:hypothetical protein
VTTAGGYTPEIWGHKFPSRDEVQPFGDDVTYERGLGWLYEGCRDVQDWGAGPAYGRRFCPPGKGYLAVDGSAKNAEYSDVIADLTEWEPDPLPDGIFMRHVLEHNEFGWRELLRHALRSFSIRFCLVVFTPFSDGGTRRLRGIGDPYCDLSFSFAELTGQMAGYNWRSEVLPTATQYGSEALFYVKPML